MLFIIKYLGNKALTADRDELTHSPVLSSNKSREILKLS